MSYNTALIVSVVILAFFIPIIAYLSLILGAEVYRKGLEHGKNLTSPAKSEPVFPEIKKKKRSAAEEAQIKKWNAVLKNLGAYNGTSEGQEKIDG